jgi:gliding motility-associated transport system ATP-binding protein
MIEASGLTRDFDNIRAVDDLDFSVGKGEIVGFLGPNGAGKSTVMRMLTGTLLPSAGRARVAGFDVVDESLEARRRIGYMPENVSVYTDSRVHEFLQFVANLKDVDGGKRETHLRDLEDSLGLLQVKDRLIGHLSKGYRQRVGLAQALVGDPEILILDEPAVGLDPHQIVEIRELIQSFRGQRTVLLSSHILGEVERICERVMILDRGRLVLEDAPGNLGSSLESTFLDLTAGARDNRSGEGDDR